MGSTAGTQGFVQLVVDNVNKSKKALGGAGLSYREGTLAQFELTNKPGAIGWEAGKEGRQHRMRLGYACKSAKKAVVVLGLRKWVRRLLKPQVKCYVCSS